MKLKNIRLSLIILCMSILCIGCSELGKSVDETEYLVSVSPDNLTCFDLVKTEVSETEFLAFLDTNPNAAELNEKYPIECFRRFIVPVWEEQIWATYRTEKNWILVYFYDNMEYDTYRSTKLESVTDSLEQVEVGMSVDEVETLDPAGDYWFRYSNMPWVSYHYTEDGVEYYIAYDGYFNVIEISKVLI